MFAAQTCEQNTIAFMRWRTLERSSAACVHFSARDVVTLTLTVRG
jgi:hypothetical protein